MNFLCMFVLAATTFHWAAAEFGFEIKNKRYSWSELNVTLNEDDTVVKLDIINASMSPLAPEFFARFENIVFLNLSGNPGVMGKGNRPEVIRSSVLSFACLECDLKQIFRFTFRQMYYLILLDLSHNKIVHVDDYVFEISCPLVNVTMSHNRLRRVPYLKPQLRRLNKLDFSFNPSLNFKHKSPVLDQPNLKELYLDHCNITVISRKTFSLLPKIVIISLKANPIVIIEYRFLSANKKLLRIVMDKHIWRNVLRNFGGSGENSLAPVPTKSSPHFSIWLGFA